MALDKVSQIGGLAGLNKPQGDKNVKGDFAGGFQKVLDNLNSKALEKVEKSSSVNPLKFSNHAVDRMQFRGVKIEPETLERISTAVDNAKAKGAKETLVLTDDSAMIVNVNKKTVITVMDKDLLKDNVFTNIDSTVIV